MCYFRLHNTIVIGSSVNFVIHPWEVVLNGSWVASIHGACCFIIAVCKKEKNKTTKKQNNVDEIHNYIQECLKSSTIISFLPSKTY